MRMKSLPVIMSLVDNVIDRLEKEMGVSRDAASALVESIITAHEVQHCMTNLALVFMSYYLNNDVDFVDKLCAEFLSEKIVDYSLVKLLPQVLESLDINPALTKSFPVLELGPL